MLYFYSLIARLFFFLFCFCVIMNYDIISTLSHQTCIFHLLYYLVKRWTKLIGNETICKRRDHDYASLLFLLNYIDLHFRCIALITVLLHWFFILRSFCLIIKSASLVGCGLWIKELPFFIFYSFNFIPNYTRFASRHKYIHCWRGCST